MAVSSIDIKTGELLRGVPPPLTMEFPTPAEPILQMSFDGGARSSADDVRLDEGLRAAGAGAALWGQADEYGRRPCVAQLILSASHLEDSMAAEAAGLRAGMALASLSGACTRQNHISTMT